MTDSAYGMSLGCNCCECPASSHPWTDVISIPYKRAICFTHDTSTVVTTVTSWVETRTYAGGTVIAETLVPTVSTDTQASDLHTISEELAWGNFIGPTLSSRPVTSPSTFEFTPPEAEAGGVSDYVRVRRYTVTQVSRTRRFRKRLAIEFDSSPIRSFGQMQQTDPALRVIRGGGFYWDAGRTVSTGTGSAYLGIVRGVAIDTPLPETVAEFDALFAEQPRTQPLGPGLTSNLSITWLPSSNAETLTLYFDQGASPGSGNIGNPRLMVQEFNTRVVDWSISPSDWVSDRVQTEPTFLRTWTILRDLPSNDIQFAYSVKLDANEALYAFTAPYEYTFRLNDAATSADVFEMTFKFIPGMSVPPWAELDLFDYGRRGTFTIRGLGMELDLNVAFHRFRPASDLLVCFYDDTIHLVPVNDGANNFTLLAGNPPNFSTYNEMMTWSSDGSWLTHGTRLVLPRDPLINPRILASISTPNEHVYLRAFGWKQTESLQTIGQERVPYDEELDETKDPRGCPEPEEFCTLIGTEENLRIEAEIEWGELSKTLPLAAGKCSAFASYEFGNKNPTDGQMIDGRLFATVYPVTHRMNATGQIVTQLFSVDGSAPWTGATKITQPFAYAGGSVTVSGFNPSDRLPARIGVNTTLERDSETGDLQLRITCTIGLWVISGGNVSSSMQTCYDEIAPFRALFGSVNVDTVSVGAAAPIGFAADPCTGQPELVTSRRCLEPTEVVVQQPIRAFQDGYYLVWVVPLGTDSIANVLELPEIELRGLDAETYDPSMPGYQYFQSLSGEIYDVQADNIDTGIVCTPVTSANITFRANRVDCFVSAKGRVNRVDTYLAPADLILRIKPQTLTPFAPAP